MKPMIYETALQLVKQKIESGEWKPGERIPTLQQLSRDLSISVTSIREALRVLENQGIVSIEHGRGMFVRNDPLLLDNPASKIRELGDVSLLTLLEARLILEPELAALCAERAAAPQVKQLRHLAERMLNEMKHGGDYFATDLQYHNLIAEAANNPVLATMLSAISDLLAESRRQTNTLPNMRTKSSSYHLLIAVAIEERQAEQARSLMKAHISDMILAIKNGKKSGTSGS